MPSKIVLNADLNVCSALRSWACNNSEVLKGFDLLVAEDVLERMTSDGSLGNLAVTSSRAIAEGGDIELAATILHGEISGLVHFPAPGAERAGDVLSEPLLRQRCSTTCRLLSIPPPRRQSLL